MDATSAASTIAGPLGELAGNFYFSRQARARGEAIGLDAVALYAAGRAGLLDAESADATFYFFKPGMIAAAVARGRSLASVEAISAAHLGAADDYAEANLAAVEVATLTAFADAVADLVAALPVGPWPLVDGYRRAPAPTSAAARAYRAAILLRELRGGVHTDAVRAIGLAPATACQLNRGFDSFRLHGYTDADMVELTPEVEAQKAAAEAATTARMAELLSPLSQTQLQAIVVGTEALRAALVKDAPG